MRSPLRNLALALAIGSLLASPSRSARAESDVYWIHLERGDSLPALRAELGWADMVRYHRPDGTTGYVAAARIRHIRDAQGADRRDQVLRHRRRLGDVTGGGASTTKYRSLAFRGGDRSICSSFLLTEAAVLIPLKADAGLEDEQHLMGMIDVGWMTNVGARSAVGASGFWESGSDHNRGGLRFRYRRWLGPRMSIELSPGIVLDGNDAFDPPGFIGQAAFNAGDILSLVVEGEVDRYEAGYWNGVSYGPVATTDTTFRVGLRGGSHLGMGSMLAAALALAAIAATFDGMSWGG